MKHFVVLVLSCWAYHTYAGGLAGAYERIMLWNAYQIERLSPTPPAYRLATGCTSPCDYVKFFHHIDGYTEEDPNFRANCPDPDVDIHETANFMENGTPERYRYVSNIIGDVGQDYNKMLTEASKIISYAGPGIRLLPANYLRFVAAHDATQNARDIRYAEWTRHILPEFEAGREVVIHTKQSGTNHGEVFDIEATLSDPVNVDKWVNAAVIKTKIEEQIADTHSHSQEMAGHWRPVVTLGDAASAQYAGLCTTTGS